jgi:hypothetical protein
MEINVPLPAEDRERLKEFLGTDEEVDRVARLVAQAGAREVLAQATGRAVFSSMADLSSFRIFCLLEQVMDLSEAEALVALLFKVPASSAKRMVNKAVARYSVELQAALKKIIVELLENATWNKESKRWEVSIPTTFVRERILEGLGRIELPTPVPAQRGPVWKFADETFQALRREFGLPETSRDDA